MTFKNTLLIGFCAVGIVSLTACGEGYEMVRTTDIMPYGNQRTAGSGIMYVQKKMMPAKELNVMPPAEEKIVEPAPAEPAPAEPVPIAPVDLSADEMDDLFREAQKK